MPLVTSGVDNGNLRELALAKMKDLVKYIILKYLTLLLLVLVCNIQFL